MRVVDYALEGRDDRLLAWMREELPTATSILLRTGFFTSAGLASVRIDLQALLDRGGRIEVLLGGSPLQYEIPALRSILALAQDFPMQVQTSMVMAPDFQNAKSYVLEHDDGHRSAWVGSANLTAGGLGSNFETAVTFDSREDDEEPINRLREAHDHIVGAPTTRALDERLLRQMQFGAQVSRFGNGRTDVELPEELLDLLQPTMDKIDAVASVGPAVADLSTGLTDLDVTLGALIPGSFTVIASRPGAGRTSLALTILRDVAIRGRVPAALFTSEMFKVDVVQRVLSAEVRIRISDMRSGRMSEAEWMRMADTINRIADSPMFIETGASPDLDALSRAVIQSVDQQNLRLIVIDPMSAIVARSFANNRERESTEVGRRLKALAMELGVAIVGCADLGRSVHYRTDKRPLLSDLGESDALAHAADAVVLLDRPDQEEPDHPRVGEADLIIAKNRHGPNSTVTVAHQLHYSRFTTLDGSVGFP
ncbi:MULTISPECIES: DnaB-like helicase C-terminal domain-containing protein [unclassified Pseudonocardia]|uniref:DnaB-like helicase C-terminal domain-containing protein n=1 Tax=unclassified Pseudonocardia TaxID=2619320 RepID=UPI00143CAEDA|nr:MULTISPECIES: DnaB-like helicase C-terminal domain-containing protein [unclassified Pseudonocardia]